MKRLACALVATLCLMSASTGFALTAEDHAAFRAQSPEYNRADQELNAVWKQLRKQLPKARYKEIQAEQRAWVGGLRDRDAMQYGGATASGYAQATQARVAYLRQVLASARTSATTQAATPQATAPALAPVQQTAAPALTTTPQTTAPAVRQANGQTTPPAKKSTPERTPPPAPQKSPVSVTPVPAVAPVTHVELPITPEAEKPMQPVVRVPSETNRNVGGTSEASGIIVQTSSSKEVAPVAQQAAPSPRQSAQTSPQPAAPQPEVTSTDDLPPVPPASPVKVSTSNALDPEKEQSLRKKKGQPKTGSKAAPKTRAFTGFPKEYQNSGHKHIRLDNAQGKPVVQLGTWGNFTDTMQDCLQRAIQSGTQVEVEGVAHAFSDGTVTMRADSPLTCRSK